MRTVRTAATTRTARQGDRDKGADDVGFLTPYRAYFQIVQIIVAVALTAAILMQARGAGLGSVFGGTGAVFKTRRGIDRLLFRITIVFAVLFALVSIIGATIPTS
jgi:preprotein translocase subunit SecG